MNDKVNPAYPAAQRDRALVTAASHVDADARERAAARVRRWQQVVDGMASGALDIGARTPVRDLPAWLTPEVVHGGFATGTPAAASPLRTDEQREVFESWLTADGLAELDEMLDTGHYRIEYAEQAALPVIAWLLRTGDTERAGVLLDRIAPYADRIRFAPSPGVPVMESPDTVYRATAGEVRRVLQQRAPNDRVETQREALAVWNPFADELLAYWTANPATAEPDKAASDAAHPDAGGGELAADKARRLLARYQALAAEHTRCGKHRDPKSNLGVLRMALEKRAAGEPLTPREAGLVRSVVASMQRKRATSQHAAVREAQAHQAAQPSHHDIAHLVASRLAGLSPDAGISDVDAAVEPVGDGWTVPKPIARIVRRATAGTPEQLIDSGLIRSAEVLAQLTPRIAAAAAAVAYDDPALRTLMDATLRAFDNRRSLLLLDLQHQVRIHELPWVQAVQHLKLNTSDVRVTAWRAMQRLTRAAIGGFPGTILPNPLIRRVMHLSQQAELNLPWTEELAADIFMGRFSPKFLTAAEIASRALHYSLYARYYAIDYDELPASGADFDRLCQDRAGYRGGWKWGRVAAAGTVIEQAQILTTHNLATAVHIGVELPWDALARRAYDTVLRLVARPDLRSIKNAAYAWRQMLVFLSLSDTLFLEYALQKLSNQPPGVRTRLEPAMLGLMAVMEGGQATDGGGRRFLGWTTSRHWMLDPA